MIGFWPNLVSSMYRGGGYKSLTRIGGPGSPGTLWSNTLNNALGLPNLVRRTAGASLTWWWPSWGQRSSEVKCVKLCAMATKLGQKNPWCEFIMTMTFMEVKGHQRSNVVIYVLWLPTWSEDSLMQVYDDDDLHGGQRSSEVKCRNYVLWLPNSVRRKPVQVYDDDDFHEGQRPSESNVVNFALWLPNLVKRIANASLKWMMTFMEVKGQMGLNIVNMFHGYKRGQKVLMTIMTCIKVKGQQRSNMIIFVIWLPHLIRCTATS